MENEILLRGSQPPRDQQSSPFYRKCDFVIVTRGTPDARDSKELIFAWLQPRDRGHDFSGHLTIDLFEPWFRACFSFGAQFGENHRRPEFHLDAPRAGKPGLSAKSFVGSKDAHGHHGRIGLDHNQADSRAAGLELTIAAARAFGEQENGSSL